MYVSVFVVWTVPVLETKSSSDWIRLQDLLTAVFLISWDFSFKNNCHFLIVCFCACVFFCLSVGKIPFIQVGNQVVSELGPIVQFTKAKVCVSDMLRHLSLVVTDVMKYIMLVEYS